MSLNLSKSQKLDLTKHAADDSGIFVVGMGWDGGGPDLDVSAIMCKQLPDGSPKDLGEEGFIFYGQLTSPKYKGVKHMGDNLTGAGDGDDEQIIVETKLLPPACDRIDIFCTVFEAKKRGRKFSNATNAYIRVGSAKVARDGTLQTVPGTDEDGAPIANADMTEIARLNLTGDYSNDTAVQSGSLYRKADGSWEFSAMGQGLGAVEIGDIFEQYEPGVVAKK
jgi:tellurium resistance protein TerD